MTSSSIQVFNGQPLPSGERILFTRNRPLAPDKPIIPYIEGDGAGPSNWRAARRTIDAAVHKAYGTTRLISWYEVFAGQKARQDFNEWLPADTIAAIRHLGVGIVGELVEPVGTGVRNKLIRETGLQHRLRPVLSLPAWPTPTTLAGTPRLSILSDIGGQNGVSVDIEPDQAESAALQAMLDKLGVPVPAGAAYALQSFSKASVATLWRRAIAMATVSRLNYLTIVHRGELGRNAESWFKEWSYLFLEDQYKQVVIPQRRLDNEHGGVLPANSLLLRDLPLHEFLTEFTEKTENHQMIICTNSLAEVLATALNAQIGMLKLAPQALLGDECGLFVASSLAADTRERMDLANPLSLIFSAIMMLDFIGWKEAAELLHYGVSKAIEKKLVTYDLEFAFRGGTKIKTSDLATVIIDHIVQR